MSDRQISEARGETRPEEVEDDVASMSLDEMIELTLDINELPDYKFAKVVQIIKQNEPSLCDIDPDELKANLETLIVSKMSINTLKELQDYVDQDSDTDSSEDMSEGGTVYNPIFNDPSLPLSGMERSVFSNPPSGKSLEELIKERNLTVNPSAQRVLDRLAAARSASTSNAVADDESTKDDRNKNDAAMSYEKMRQLSLDMNMLPRQNLARLVQIVQETEPSLSNSDPDEIEIDLEDLGAITLENVKVYVADCLQSLKR